MTKLLKENKIRVSNSPYGVPTLFAKKKDRQLNICVDYCVLNKSTILDPYPLPCIKQLLSQLKGAPFFSHLDLKYGYFHIPIAKEDVYKMVFSCRYSMLEYLVIPFGLMNAPSIF